MNMEHCTEEERKEHLLQYFPDAEWGTVPFDPQPGYLSGPFIIRYEEFAGHNGYVCGWSIRSRKDRSVSTFAEDLPLAIEWMHKEVKSSINDYYTKIRDVIEVQAYLGTDDIKLEWSPDPEVEGQEKATNGDEHWYSKLVDGQWVVAVQVPGFTCSAKQTKDESREDIIKFLKTKLW